MKVPFLSATDAELRIYVVAFRRNVLGKAAYGMLHDVETGPGRGFSSPTDEMARDHPIGGDTQGVSGC